MPLIRSTVKKLQRDYPEYHFEPATGFWWSAAKGTIFYDPNAPDSDSYTLHELSHALLGHSGYDRDVELLKLERDAWEYAKTTLGKRYGAPISEEIIQENLDTYREWLHARSRCPECETTGLQSKSSLYRCLACGQQWRVNEARLCALRRYSLQTK